MKGHRNVTHVDARGSTVQLLYFYGSLRCGSQETGSQKCCPMFIYDAYCWYMMATVMKGVGSGLDLSMAPP